MFGDLPDATTIMGNAIVAASGLYVLYREAGAGRRGEDRASRPATGRSP